MIIVMEYSNTNQKAIGNQLNDAPKSLKAFSDNIMNKPNYSHTSPHLIHLASLFRISIPTVPKSTPQQCSGTPNTTNIKIAFEILHHYYLNKLSSHDESHSKG